MTASNPPPGPPLGLLAELTHRCPLMCPYCSNPLELSGARAELATDEWLRVIDDAAAMGVLQIHLSGGEPVVRRDLEQLVARCRADEIYTNLITAGVLLDEARLAALAEAGLEHVQLSIQDSRAATADRIGGYAGGHAKKLAVARLVRAAGLPLTVNAVVHRQNLDHLSEIIELAVELGARRLEVAHTQYYGWAYANRAALMPTPEQVTRANEVVAEARGRLKGVLTIDYVVPDYYAKRPKACMGGWGRQFLNVTPTGKVLPVPRRREHHRHDLRDGARARPAEIWADGPAFRRFRGTDWMPEPCRSCDRREIDFGGCRCQAFALTGDAAATDPACGLSPHHDRMVALAEGKLRRRRRPLPLPDPAPERPRRADVNARQPARASRTAGVQPDRLCQYLCINRLWPGSMSITVAHAGNRSVR
ncbi:MAG: pyrroloquinoline quinone biosynthesis protein PqqE [Rhodovibrio sp.]|nr:pyrroloquinoline quinone biosynthesis protein PqqE [Rhodovibrio sp.]